jgi:WD40 repeat protein
VRVLQNTQARQIGGLSFGPGGRTLVAGGSGGYDIWNLATASHAFIASHAVKYLYGCVYDPLGRWFYVSDYLGGFRLLPLDGNAPPPVPGSPHERHVTSFDLTPSGGRLVMCRSGRVECWDVRPPESFVPAWSLRDGEPVDPSEPYLLNEATWGTNGVAIARDGRTVATAENRSAGTSGVNPLVVLRDGSTGRVISELGRSETSFNTRLAFATDDQALFTWDDRVLERWDTAAARQTGRLPAPGRAYFQGLAVHPSGRLLVTVSGDGQARYWEPADLSPVRTLKWGIGKLHAVAVSADGTLAAAGGDKGQLVVWDVEV